MKKTKLATLMLCASLMLHNIVVVQASQQTITDVSEVTVDVTAEIGSDYSITLPKRIVLDSKTKTAEYNVSVNGDISGNSKLYVVPDSSFAFQQNGKNDVIATVAQDKTLWTMSDITTNAIGNISAKDLTSGTWMGIFQFRIELQLS